MESKEDILKNINQESEGPFDPRTVITLKSIYRAMDEYAKQEAILFSRVAADYVMGKFGDVYKTDDDLYQQYLNSKTNVK